MSAARHVRAGEEPPLASAEAAREAAGEASSSPAACWPRCCRAARETLADLRRREATSPRVRRMDADEIALAAVPATKKRDGVAWGIAEAAAHPMDAVPARRPRGARVTDSRR